MRSRLSIAVLSVALAMAFTAAPRATAYANNWGHGGANVHCVHPGETLSGIAWKYGTTAQAIAHANGLWNPNYVRAGQCLTIPAGWSGGHDKGWNGGYQGETAHAGWNGGHDMKPGYNDGGHKVDYKYGGMAGDAYCVRHGDTLYSIANRYGTTAWAIAHANGLWNPNYIRAGQMLTIPGHAW